MKPPFYTMKQKKNCNEINIPSLEVCSQFLVRPKCRAVATSDPTRHEAGHLAYCFSVAPSRHASGLSAFKHSFTNVLKKHIIVGRNT
jgi:hypothetical protein